jgi:hypothetical protein
MIRRVMPRTGVVFALLVLALLLGMLPAERAALSGPHPLVVLATASNRGEVDPCG